MLSDYDMMPSSEMRSRVFRWSAVRLLSVWLCGLCIGGVIACSGDTTGPASSLTASQAYWALQLNQHAVTLALAPPMNTIQLHATPLNAAGTPLTGLGAVRYSASDSTVQVDSTGLVTAKYTSEFGVPYSFVVASLTDAGQRVTLVDTCFIFINETAPASPLATFSIQPAARDSARRSLKANNKVYTVRTNAADNSDQAFTDFFAYFTSSDPSIATIDEFTGAVKSYRIGHVTFYATTWAYGVAKQDSLPFTITLPTTQKINVLSVVPTGSSTPILTFWPQIVTVGIGTIVTWVNPSLSDSIDVVFDDPTNVDSVPFTSTAGFSTGRGNITPWLQDTLGTGSVIDSLIWNYYDAIGLGNCVGFLACQERQRLFPRAGTYHYHSTLYPSSGTIVVQ